MTRRLEIRNHDFFTLASVTAPKEVSFIRDLDSMQDTSCIKSWRCMCFIFKLCRWCNCNRDKCVCENRGRKRRQWKIRDGHWRAPTNPRALKQHDGYNAALTDCIWFKRSSLTAIIYPTTWMDYHQKEFHPKGGHFLVCYNYWEHNRYQKQALLYSFKTSHSGCESMCI